VHGLHMTKKTGSPNSMPLFPMLSLVSVRPGFEAPIQSLAHIWRVIIRSLARIFFRSVSWVQSPDVSICRGRKYGGRASELGRWQSVRSTSQTSDARRRQCVRRRRQRRRLDSARFSCRIRQCGRARPACLHCRSEVVMASGCGTQSAVR
jgi:hypothetical protein